MGKVSNFGGARYVGGWKTRQWETVRGWPYRRGRGAGYITATGQVRQQEHTAGLRHLSPPVQRILPGLLSILAPISKPDPITSVLAPD